MQVRSLQQQQRNNKHNKTNQIKTNQSNTQRIQRSFPKTRRSILRTTDHAHIHHT